MRRSSWFSFLALLCLVINSLALTQPAETAPKSTVPAGVQQSSVADHVSLPSGLDRPESGRDLEVARSTEIQSSLGSHRTIGADAVRVTGPSEPINPCDRVAFTIVATNDTFTATNVVITSTMPIGFVPTERVFVVGEVRPNQTITRTAVFSATCDAVSGQNVVTLTQDGAPPIVKRTDFVIAPGAITVRNDPPVIPAALDEIVTWTVQVQNTGYGRVSNVVVTDVLGSGLEYISGITATTFTSIPVGGTQTFTVSARVVRCTGLENVVTATWGCGNQACAAPQTAKGAVDLRMTNPDLDFVLPSFDIAYCAGSAVFTVPVTNTGDSTAYSGTLKVALSPFGVTVAPPASYVSSTFYLPPIPPKGTYNLVFTLTLPSAVCTMPRSGTFDFQLEYSDRCGNRYTELPWSADWRLVDTPGRLSVEKLAPREVYRGETVTAPIAVTADGIVGTIVVTDRVPPGWSVEDADGGNVFAVGGTTYVTWALNGSAVLRPVFATPDDSTGGCQYCGAAATNIVTATASDCRNCRQSATAEATMYLQCNEPVAVTSKQVSGPSETCADPAYTYTNTYTFADTFTVTPTWQGLIFTETLLYQSYVLGSAEVWVSDGVTTCPAQFSAGVTSGVLSISAISPTCSITVPGATLRISYNTAVTEPARCSDFEWYDWSYLDLGVRGNAACAADGVIEEGVFVQTLNPAMTLDLSGLPSWVSPCGVYSVTLNARRLSIAPAYDVVIDVPTSTFAVLDVLGFSGPTPVYTETDASGYHWYYSDTFATVTTGTLRLRVQLRCENGRDTASFRGELRYDNRCADNDTYRERCLAGGALGSTRIVRPLPIMTKFPEIIYAYGDVVTWTLTAYNSGAGPAHNVVLTDALGSGLRYWGSSITSTLGSSAGVTPITSSRLVTWVLPIIQPKEKVTIRYAAEVVDCEELTNCFAGRQGCLGQVCESGGPVYSRVEVPPAVLLNTSQALTPIDTCYTRTVTVTVRNAGLLSVYSATLTETLPAGLSYVSGTTEVSMDAANWQPGPDPTIVGQSLSWVPASGPPLDSWLSRVRPGQTVYVRFQVYASCPFEGGQLRIQTGYLDTCRRYRLSQASYFVMPVRTSRLTLTKTGVNLNRPSPAPGHIYAEPGETVVFTLTLSNADAAPARAVVVTDTLPPNTVFWSASPGYTGPIPGSLGGFVTWSFVVIPPNTTIPLTVTTVVSQPEGCTVTDTYNLAEAAWGCPDGCRQGVRSDRVILRTRPVFEAPVVRTDVPPATLHRCGGLITITLNNQGPPAYRVTLTDTLPSGYVYSHTVYASTPPSGTVDLGQTVVYTWSVLPTGPTTLTLAVRNSASAGGCAAPYGPNSVTLTYDDDVSDCGTTGPYSVTATTNINVIGPNLTVDKSLAALTARVGERVTWTLTVRNVGSGAAYNVVVTDVVGSSFSDVTATNGSDGTAPVVNGNRVVWNPLPIAANGIWRAQVSAVLQAEGGNQNVVTATTSCDTGCLIASASDVARVTLLQQFDKGPVVQTGTIGSLVVFTFTASLPDVDVVYQSVTLTDTLPTGLGYVSAVLTYTYDADQGPGTSVSVGPTSNPGHLASGDVIWRLGDLTGSVRITGVLTAVVQNILSNQDGIRRTNTLRLSYMDDGRLYHYTDTAHVDILEPNLLLGKRVSSSTGTTLNLDGRAALTYTLVITNTGRWPTYDVLLRDRVPAGILVTGVFGGDSRSVPAARPLTWTISVIPPNTAAVVSYTARIHGASPNVNLTNVVTSTWTSTPDDPVGQERNGSDGPGGALNDYAVTDAVTVRTAQIAFGKRVSPPSTATNPLRVGDVVTYTIVTTVPPGIYVPWPFQYDDLPPGVRYVSGTFTVTSTMPFVGSDPLASATSYDSRPNGVSGDTSASNPRIGRSEASPPVETVEWWLDPLDNRASSVPGIITVTFRAQLTGIDRNGTVQWTTPQSAYNLNNTARMYWNNSDLGAYNGSSPTQTLSAGISSYVGQPLLHINKTYSTAAGCSATLLEDAFNRASTTPPSGWTAVSGEWNIVSGYAQQSGTANPAILVRTGFSASDFSYSAMVRSGDDTSSRGLVFRYTSGNYYLVRLRQGDGGNSIDLQEIASGTISILATKVVTPATGWWYHIEVRAETVLSGLRIRAYIDGRQYFDVIDPTPRPVGSVGFYANECNPGACNFDDVFVTRLGQTSCSVGANDFVTYTLTISNHGRTPAYNIVVSDVLPAELTFVNSTLVSAPPGTAFDVQPVPGATGTITWAINVLSGTAPSGFYYGNQKTMQIRVVALVTDTVGANTRFINSVFLPYYDSQPGSGPTGTPIVFGTDADQRVYKDGSHSVGMQTVNGGISKRVMFSPPPTATLGSLVTYTLVVPAQPISATLYNVRVTDTLDNRLQIVALTAHDSYWSYGWSGQVATATFAAIPHHTQAYVTITARLHTDRGARSGDVITDTAQMSHATAPLTTSNPVITVVGEPHLRVGKSVESSTGSLNGLDGTALLTYTLRLTNTGTSPAYSVHVTDSIPSGISVTALYGGQSRSAPTAGPGVITWTVDAISNLAPANVAVLTYTARISGALVNSQLTNTMNVLYHSLTETIPGVRSYTSASSASVGTAQPTVRKSTEPFVLRVGDVVTYRVVFTVPAGTVWSGNTLLDGLNPGLWYITDSERLDWAPSTVNVAVSNRSVTTTEVPGHQVIRWTFAPITSEQAIPTVVTLTFRAQAVGQRIDTSELVWTNPLTQSWPGNYVQLEFPWPHVVTDVVTNLLIQPHLEIAKDSTPLPGSYVGAGERITYTLTVTNSGYGLAYDIVISDVLPSGLSYVTSTVTSGSPSYIRFLSEPPVGATGVLTWRVNELWGREWGQQYVPKVATIIVVARVTETIGANLVLTNTAAIPYYDSQPGDGPGPYAPDEREYSDGMDSVNHRTVDAAIAKTVIPATATLGDVVTYVLVVPSTPISATLYNVQVTDTLDSRLQLQAVTGGAGATVVTDGNTFAVTYASVPAGHQRWITATAVLSSPLGASAGDVITNVAVLRHQDGGPTFSNLPAFAVTEPALILVKASDPSPSSTVHAGQRVTFTVRITNAAGEYRSAAYDLVFTDTLPVGMRVMPPQLISVTLNGLSVPASDYESRYNSATGVFTVAFSPTFSIPVSGTLVIQYAAVVDIDVPAAVDLANRAGATWSSLPGAVPGDRDYGPITDTTILHTPLGTGLSKAAFPPTVTIGSRVVFTVTVPDPPVGAVLHRVILTDVVDTRLRVDAVSANASVAGQVVTAAFATIPTYTQRTVVITATVRDLVTTTAGTQIPNLATFDYRDNPVGPIDSDVVTVTVAEPRLSLAKSVTVPRDPLGAGDLVTYTLTVSNIGTWPAYDLVITDALPAGVDFVSTAGFFVTDPVTATRSGSYPQWRVSQLNVGGSVYLTFTARVRWDIGAGLTLTNTGEGYYESQPGATPDERRYTIPPDAVPVETGYPALQLGKAAVPSPVEAGALLTYTLTVTNTGLVSATGVVITDVVPSETRFVTATLPHTGPDVSGVITWYLGTVGVNRLHSVTMVVRVDPSLSSGGVITNAGWVTSSEGLSDTDTVTTPVVTRADVAIRKSDDHDPVIVGTLLTYTLVVTNHGPSVARSVVVTDVLPPEVEFVSATPVQSLGPDPLVWQLGDLGVGETRRLTVTARVLVTTTRVFTNVIVVNSETPDSDPGNNQDEEPTHPLVPALEVAKDVAPGEAVRNMPFTYTIRITNTGRVTFDPLVLTDTLPADFYYVAGSGNPSDPDRIDLPTLVWTNLGPLDPGESLTVSFAVTATPGLTGTYWNWAFVEGTTPGGTVTDTDDAPVAIADPTVALEKRLAAADLDLVAPNYVTFTIVITNTGVSPINVLPLFDQYDPAYLSFVDADPYPNEDADDGLLTWYDLTASSPNSFGRNLLPGEAFYVTTTFRVVQDITTTVNTAIVSDVLDVYTNPANDAEDEEPVSGVPTAVELLYFRVGCTSGQQVVLEWATAVEIDNFGFSLYRGTTDERGRAEQIAFVPSEARGGGATYRYTDTVPYDGDWYYWLADVDTEGQETFHGPVRAVVGAVAYTHRLYLPLVLRYR